MAAVYNTPFSNAEVEYLKSKFIKITINNVSGRYEWHGTCNKDGYPIIRPRFRDKVQIFTVHRLVAYIANNCNVILMKQFMNLPGSVPGGPW